MSFPRRTLAALVGFVAVLATLRAIMFARNDRRHPLPDDPNGVPGSR